MMKLGTLEQLKKEALQQFKEGKSVFRKEGGAFAVIEADIEHYLTDEQRGQANKRNGKKSKTIKTSEGSFSIQTHQDRKSELEPQIVRKRQTIIEDSMQDKIIKLYGLSLREISEPIEKIERERDLLYTIESDHRSYHSSGASLAEKTLK